MVVGHHHHSAPCIVSELVIISKPLHRKSDSSSTKAAEHTEAKPIEIKDDKGFSKTINAIKN
jgi:hypothetical protein